MSLLPGTALEQALAALRAPSLFAQLRDRPLPDDVLLLLRLAAGDSQAREQAREASGEPDPLVTEAAVMFIQQVMFYPGSDSYRVLGVPVDGSDESIREHRRWLLRWLHPDRNADAWDAVYAERVSHAWQALRTPERRDEYDSREPAAVEASPRSHEPLPVAQFGRAVPERAPGMPLFSRRTMQRLPVIIFGGLALCSLTILGLLYYVSREEGTPPGISPASVLDKVRPAEQQPPAALAQVASTPITPIAPVAPTAAIAPIVSKVPVIPARAAPPAADPSLLSQAPPARHPAPAPVRMAVPTRSPSAPRGSKPAVAVSMIPKPLRPAEPAVVPAAVESAPIPPSYPQSALIDEASAQDLAMRFRSAYASGNIDQLRLLLVDAEGGDRANILRSYGELFDASVSRRMELSRLVWLTEGDAAILLATYEAWIQPRGKSRQRHFKGDIRFDLRSEAGRLKIARVRHGVGGG